MIDIKRAAQINVAAKVICLLLTETFDPLRHNNALAIDAAVRAIPKNRAISDLSELVETIKINLTIFPQEDGLVFSTSVNTPFMEPLKRSGIISANWKVEGQLHMFGDGDVVVRFPMKKFGDYLDFPITYSEQPDGPKADYSRAVQPNPAEITPLGSISVTLQTPRFTENPTGNGSREKWNDSKDSFELIIGDWILDEASPKTVHALGVQSESRNRPCRELHSQYVKEEPAGTCYVLLNPRGNENGISAPRERCETAAELRSLIDGLRGRASDPSDSYSQSYPEEAFRITEVIDRTTLPRDNNSSPSSDDTVYAEPRRNLVSQIGRALRDFVFRPNI